MKSPFTYVLNLLFLLMPMLVEAQTSEPGIPQAKISEEKSAVTKLSKYSEIHFGPLFKKSGISLNYSYIVHKTDAFGYGGGLDWTRYSFDEPFSLVALYGKTKYYFGRGQFKTFVSGKFGYGLPVGTVDEGQLNSSGGLYGDVGAGIRVGRQAPLLEIYMGLRMQKAMFEYSREGILAIDDVTFKRLSVMLAFLF